MNAQGFLDLISKANDLENADLKKALKLQEKYPYFLAPKVLAAKYEWDKASGASKTLLHWAAVVSPDRKRLKSLLTGTSPIVPEKPLETPPETQDKDSKPKEAKEIVATIAPPEPKKTNTQKEEVGTDNTSRPKRDEILRRLEENLKNIKKTAPSSNESNQAQVKKKEEALEKKTEKKEAISESKKKKTTAKKNKKAQQKLIDDFKEKPIRLTKDKLDESVALPDLSEQSTHLNHSMLSESYAKLLVKQNKKNEAVEIYQKLILNFPKKRAYFADQIEKLRE